MQVQSWHEKSLASEKAVFRPGMNKTQGQESSLCTTSSRRQQHLCANNEESIIYAQGKELEEQETGNNKIQI